MEAQAKQHKSYDMETRGIAYCGRLISEQFGRNIANSHYENIQKVYSIWICMNCPQKDANTISEYGIREVNRVGNYTKNPRVDLLSLVMIRLPKDGEWDKAKSPANSLMEMLATLLSNQITPDRKIRTLENKFGIEATEDIRQEVSDMCNYSNAIRDEGVNEGQIRGAIKAYRDMELPDNKIKEKLIQIYKLTEDEAIEYLNLVTA